MPKNILVINSSADKNCLLTLAFKELERKNYSFSLWSSKMPLINQFARNHWPAKKVFLGFSRGNEPEILLFVLTFLFLELKLLVSLIKLKTRNQVDLIVCLDLNEKILITVPARLLKIKTVWLESPELNYRQINKLLFWLYRINLRLAEIITFNNYGKAQLASLGYPAEKINLVFPGAKPCLYQENIYNKLASSGQTNFHRKYFTVGAVTTLNQKQKIETIFQAVKNCLPLVANIQLIVIGEGRERKNLLWLAKKMQIENLVWLVGEQEQLKKWLDSFDIYLAASDCLKLDDYGNILEAMTAGLPVLGPRNLALEDLVVENKTGALIEADNSEMLARQIIKLHQDKGLRLFLGKNGRERVNKFFTLDKMVENMRQILLI